jgi:hypothetical protein
MARLDYRALFQDFNGFLHAIEALMLISKRGFHLAVTEDLHDVRQAHTLPQGLADHARRGSMPKAVEIEVFDP